MLRVFNRHQFIKQSHLNAVFMMNYNYGSERMGRVEIYLKIQLKGPVVWEKYECVSEVLAYLGRKFGMIFRVQWGQKSPKSGKMCLTKMYPGPCKVAARSLQGCCT